jgi:hypothetical protein
MPIPVTHSTSACPTPRLSGLDRQLAEVNELLSARRLEKAAADIKYELAALRVQAAILRHAHVCRKAGFREEQARWPKGSGEDSGRWSGGGAGSTPPQPKPSAERPAPYQLAARGSQSAAYCWNQMQIDMLFCTTLRPSIIRACRAQAMERYSACITGKPLPPLLF